MNRFFDPRFIAPVAILAMAVLATPADAQQQTGDLEGTVTTADGKSIAGAKVTLSGAANIGGEKSESTADDGGFRFLRLLPGDYKVTIEADGYEGLTTTLRVGIGKTARIAAPLKPAAGEGVEVIEVSAEKLAVDTKRIDVGTSFSAEFLQAVPSGREYQSVARFAPGVVGGGNPNINGGSEASNLYLVDGVNTTDPTTNTFGLNFNFDAIEELQVLTGGFHPRYGNVTGGVINVVTKSGSNEFELDTSVYYTGRLLQIDSPDEEFLPDDEKRNFWNIGANLNFGGPIIEDKLWYYFSTEYNYSVSQLPAGSPFLFPNSSDPLEATALEAQQNPERVYQSLYWLAKFTAQLDRHNRVTLMGIADPASIDNTIQSPDWSPDAERHQDQNGFTGKIDWEADYDPLVVQVKVSHKRSLLDIFPQKQLDGTATPFNFPGIFGFGALSDKTDFSRAPGCLADSDRSSEDNHAGCSDIQAHPQFGNGLRFFSNNQGVIYAGNNADITIERLRTDASAEVSYFLDDMGGDHKIDVGFQLALTSDDETERYPGGASVFVDLDTDGDRLPDPFFARIASSDGNELSQKASGQVMAGYIADTWTFADRFTVQPGVRVENAVHEDYKENAVLDFFTISPRIGFSVDPFANGRTRVHGGYARLYESGNLGLSKFVGTSLQTRIAYWDDEAGRYIEQPGQEQVRGGEAGTEVDPELETMSADEFRLGIEQAIGESMAIGATYVHRQTSLAWEDDETNLIWDQAGADIIGSRAGDGQQTFRLTSLEEAQRTFDSLQLSFRRSNNDGWGVNGSYTLAWNRGTTGDLLTRGFDNPRQNAYLDGPLPDDIRHNIKAQGYYEWDNGFRLGFAYRYKTGGPYSPAYRDIVNEDFLLRRAPRGYYVGNDPNDPSDDRIQRLPDFSQFDTRIAWNLDPLTGQKFTLSVDIFNIMNLNSVTDLVTDASFTDADGNVPQTNFREPTNYQSPLRVQLGVRYQY